jgi:hypothetical protein
MMNQILICDDDSRATRSWHDRLEALDSLGTQFKIVEYPAAELPILIGQLEERRDAARHNKMVVYDTPLDKSRVLIVDYDLLEASKTGFVTGENLAYLARCYSSVDIIIGLNQFYRGNVFDLNLRGYPESFADVNISDLQLTNIGLWSTNFPKSSFRPWNWPVIPALCDLFEARIRGLKGNLDAPITEYLGFPKDIFDFLEREAQAFVASGNDGLQDLRTVTFRQFVERSGQGLRGKDVQRDEAQLCRIAAARVGAWLERMILVNQNVLVDLPHLVERTPSVVGDKKDLVAIRRSARLDDQALAREDAIGKHAFARSEWLSRPAWWWPPIETAEELTELAEPWNFAGLPVVFCEDTSDFVPSEDTRVFAAGIQSPFARRYIACLKDVDYRPQVRFVR